MNSTSVCVFLTIMVKMSIIWESRERLTRIGLGRKRNDINIVSMHEILKIKNLTLKKEKNSNTACYSIIALRKNCAN